MSKTDVFFLRLYILSSNPFVRNKVRVSKNCVFFATLVGLAGTLSHEMKFECQKRMFLFAILHSTRQPFRTKQGSGVKNCVFFATLVGPAATASHEMRFECHKN